ncbi:hypothetical protein [Desulfatibacillum aliphaticivorans]|uniref:hypothetical protein n=1 Tax=Desulfatibacillum aliphaticivorans TaxID=218208 RepID=UPI0003FC540B|nr:hypothetical protein [Desulfatibacillum aliphaticivorans]
MGKEDASKEYKWFWPDTSDPTQRKKAVDQGAWAGLWITLSFCFILFINSSTLEIPAANIESIVLQFILFRLFVYIIVIPGFLTWRVWKENCFISAILILIYMVCEVILTIMDSGSDLFLLKILAVVLAMNGVRGTLAERKIRSSQQGLPQEQPIL